MDSHLEAVRHKIPKVEDKIERIEQDLAAAKEAKNGEQERKLLTSGREEIAARANKKLPPPSSFAKPSGEGGWTHPKLRELQQYMCFHRSPSGSPSGSQWLSA
ncbi:hypothetical protein ABBQ32_012370 [Trebouxia sp. C0010 RCD-2024]